MTRDNCSIPGCDAPGIEYAPLCGFHWWSLTPNLRNAIRDAYGPANAKDGTIADAEAWNCAVQAAIATAGRGEAA